MLKGYWQRKLGVADKGGAGPVAERGHNHLIMYFEVIVVGKTGCYKDEAE